MIIVFSVIRKFPLKSSSDRKADHDAMPSPTVIEKRSEQYVTDTLPRACIGLKHAVSLDVLSIPRRGLFLTFVHIY